MNIRKRILIIFSPIIFLSLFSCEEKETEVLFNYEKILKKEFKKNVGRAIPVTINQSIEAGGVFTNDGLFFFFTSDRDRGNFDIYLRSLVDITAVKVIGHASKDTSPAISANGKYLAFVSEREDPEGDIYVVKLKPEKIIKEAKTSITEAPTMDSSAENLTQHQDPTSKTIKIIKDASPCWSSDSEWIAFSSARGGKENIWIMNRKGKGLAQLTKKGGMYPSFSNDNKSIIYISYRDKNSNGDIYTIDIATGREKRITSTGAVELHPSFMGNDREIVYTLIDRDTNNDGRIDLRDNSVIYYKNLKSGLAYSLTLYSESSFSPRWSPLYKGIVIYSNQTGENINVNIIPDYGIIPNRGSARRQFKLAEERYLKEFDDTEKYLACLERTYHFFGRKKDTKSKIFVTKALTKAAKKYKQLGMDSDALRVKAILSSLSKDKNDYSSISASCLAESFKGKAINKTTENALFEIKQDKNKKPFVPYLMGDLGDELKRLGKIAASINVYHKIITGYPKYSRIINVHYKLGTSIYKSLKENISPSILKVLESKNPYLRNDSIKYLLSIFEKEKNLKKRISLLKAMLKKHESKKKMPALLIYAISKAYFEMNDLAKAKIHLLEAIKLTTKSELVFYKSNMLLGRIVEKENNFIDMEKFYFSGVINYKEIMKQDDYRKIILKLIDFYEEYGDRTLSAGDYRAATVIYDRYVYIMRTPTFRRTCADLYKEYSPRAHVLYIDAYSEWKGNNPDDLLKLESKYIESKEYNLANARLDFNKAHIYGLGYIYVKLALSLDKGESLLVPDVTELIQSDREGMLQYFKKAMEQIEWALFMDDTFIDPDILKGWIYQYVDQKRREDIEESGGKNEKIFSKYFPKYLWEKNIPIYEKALEFNNESEYPEKEGNLHLNIANAHFLLQRFSKALTHYRLAQRYKKNFNSKIEEALFHYHIGYCYWQADDLERAKDEIGQTLYIYRALASGDLKRFRYQIYHLYRFFALFNRIQKNYSEAISWYNRIIEFSQISKIEIDRARYFQEIAHCYNRLGKDDYSLAYLHRANSLIKSSIWDEKKYYLKIGIFGLAPFPIPWDIGEDTFVIGDSRIFTSLNAVHQRLLNVSIEENIHYDKGDLHKAIQSLKNKLNLLEGRESKLDKDITVRTLNNIGFCYYRLRRFDEAGGYFKRAWDFAADPDVNDLEGTFISILNSTNLFTFLLENNIKKTNTPLAEIESLISRIIQYRDLYENKRFDDEKEKLIKDAELQKREINDEVLRTIREDIKEEAENKYYRLDIALGVLKYQKANLLQISKNNGKGDIEKAYSLYRLNREIFDLYSDAIKRFETAIARAESLQSKRLLVKLLINLGTCQKRIGLFDEAYSSYSDAEILCDDLEYHNLVWKVYNKTATFLMEHGEEVEGEEYTIVADEYFGKALKVIEEFPYLFLEDIYRIKTLYDEYAGLLISKGEYRRALSVSERKYEIVRLMNIAQSSPDFYDKTDMSFFSGFTARMTGIGNLRKELSQILEKGDPEDTGKVAAIKKELKDKSIALKSIIKNGEKTRPLVTSYISVSKAAIPKYENAIIYKFYERDGKLSGWKIDSGTVQFKNFSKDSEGQRSILSAIKQFLQDDGEKKHRFIVLDETALKILQDNGNDIPPFMFTPSIERVKYYLSPNSIALNKIYYTGSGLAKSLTKINALNDIKVNEGEVLSDDLSRYSVIIDEKGKIEPQDFFHSRLQPTLLLKKIDYSDPDNISQIIESSLYSGIKTLYLYDSKIGVDDISNFLKEASKKSFAGARDSAVSFNRALGIGFMGYRKSERSGKLSSLRDAEYNKFIRSMKKVKVAEARLHINKWHSIPGDNPERDNALYSLSMAEIEFIKENYNSALTYIDNAINASGKKLPELYAKSIAYKIYLLLYMGNIDGARTLLNSADAGNFNKTSDYIILKSITALSTENDEPSIEKYRKSLSNKTILPSNKLKLLYAEYLNLFNRPGIAKDILSNWNPDYPLSGRDLIKASILTGKSKSIVPASRRAKDIATLKIDSVDLDKYREKAIQLLADNGRYDGLTPLAACIAINKFIKHRRLDAAFSFLHEVDIQEIKKSSHWMDTMLLLSLARDIYGSEKRHEDTLRFTDAIIDVIPDKDFTSLMKHNIYEKSILLSLLERHSESYEAAKAGRMILCNDEDLTIKYELLIMENEIYLGMINEIALREKKIKSNPKPEYLYILDLLKSRIELLKMLRKKKATKTEWDRVENLILGALEILDTSPDILKRLDRIDMLKESIDILISYKMKTGDYRKALLLSEIQKQLILRSKFPHLIHSGELPDEAVKEFKSIKDKKNSSRFIILLQRHPWLQIGALAQMLPVGHFQKRIPKDSMALYLTANGNDILGWIISKKFVKYLRIQNGYARLAEIEKRYNARLSLMKNTINISKDIYKIFKPLEEYYRDKKTIIFITDNALEKVPFEIMGEGIMLEESHAIVYLPSILSTFMKYNPGKNIVNLIKSREKNFYHELEFLSIKESGIPYKSVNFIKSGIGHLHGKILIDPIINKLYIENNLFDESVKNAKIIYVPEFDISNRMSYNNFAMICSLLGIKKLIINDSKIHDVNNAVFVDNLYGKIHKGDSLLKAFQQAKKTLRLNKRYSYPSYWAGIRLYLNGI